MSVDSEQSTRLNTREGTSSQGDVRIDMHTRAFSGSDLANARYLSAASVCININPPNPIILRMLTLTHIQLEAPGHPFAEDSNATEKTVPPPAANNPFKYVSLLDCCCHHGRCIEHVIPAGRVVKGSTVCLSSLARYQHMGDIKKRCSQIRHGDV